VGGNFKHRPDILEPVSQGNWTNHRVPFFICPAHHDPCQNILYVSLSESLW